MGSLASKCRGGHDINARTSDYGGTCVPILFCSSRHRHMVSRKKAVQQSVHSQSCLDHCAYSPCLQANISWRSLDQSPFSASMSGFSTRLKDRFPATKESRPSRPLRSPQSNNITGEFLYAMQQNTHSFRSTERGAFDSELWHRLRHNEGLLR